MDFGVHRFTADQFARRQLDAEPRGGIQHRDLLLRGDTTAGLPPLDSGVIGVTERGGQLALATETANDKVSGFHGINVRLHRTAVNLENVRPDNALIEAMEQPSLASQLRQLRERSGLSFRELAKAMGSPNASSIQHMFKDEYRTGRLLDLDVAKKLVTAMVGRGNPPIMPDDILTLAGWAAPRSSGPSEATEIATDRELTHGLKQLPRDIPVYGTAIGGPLEISQANGSSGEPVSIDQTSLDRSEAIDYLRRTPALANKRNIYGVFITGSSMVPRFAEGEIAVVDPHYTPKIGDDVIVQLRGADNPEAEERVTCVLIKRLVRRSGSFIELEQFNPALVFRIDLANVRHMHRVVPMAEVLAR